MARRLLLDPAMSVRCQVAALAVVGLSACSGHTTTGSTQPAGGKVWTSNSAAIEIWSRSPFGGSLRYLWEAKASDLTDQERSMLAGLSQSKPSDVQAQACDEPWFDVYVTDRAGKRHAFIAIDPQCSTKDVLSYNAVEAIASCPGTNGTLLASAPAQAPLVVPGRCSAVGYSGTHTPSAADLWARVSVPSAQPWVAEVREPDGTNTDAALRLYDSTGTSLVSKVAPGAPLDVAGPGDFAIDLHAVSAKAQVGLVLSLE